MSTEVFVVVRTNNAGKFLDVDSVELDLADAVAKAQDINNQTPPMQSHSVVASAVMLPKLKAEPTTKEAPAKKTAAKKKTGGKKKAGAKKG